MIDLFSHNLIAYKSAIAMLKETNKAAIIHPTGTGKSFIAFKLCEDNIDKTICWLSPSEYIFKTQIENLKIANDGQVFQNIKFYTYSKLMNMEIEDLKEIKPDFIILDEFHRCGAEMWGKGVQKLLNLYPNQPILGLSATNIRYLDNQRDMADELFDGNVASEMTLGEAIVRGILNAPKYVLSVYSYKKDLKKYEDKVRKTRNKAIRSVGEKYLEALRRTIEKAEGLEDTFNKHITDRTGKYIVFCSSKEHMDEMQTHVHEWFWKVDDNPHVYSVYTEQAGADKEFNAFKNDEDNNHLRLLFCIDALNEGIHIENVSGVILLRPTTSPIIYKQQIGRALSASKSKEPIIFDIVNNVENLYSIGTIEEEMQVAITYYRYLGEDSKIVNERFTLCDEVKNCRTLFEKLEESLSASWDTMYEFAKDYYCEHGNLDVPRRYKTAKGYSLGSWLTTQRKVRAGEQFGNLDSSRIAKLDEIGMRWEASADIAWKKYYDASKRYYEEFGNLNVEAKYVDSQAVKLGPWICYLRSLRNSGSMSNYLTKDKIEALDCIGMIWNQPNYVWQRNFSALSKFYCENGHLDVPVDCVVDGIKIGVLIRNIRSAYKGKNINYKLTEEQISQLNSIGMVWEAKQTAQWEKGFKKATKYKNTNGNLNVSISYVTNDGFNLGRWLNRQISLSKKGQLSLDRQSRLNSLDLNWQRTRVNSWEYCFELVKKYYQINGSLKMPAKYIDDGIWLYKWLNEQRQIYYGKRNGKTLSDNQIKMLESVGMEWRSYEDIAWDGQFNKLKEYVELNGTINVEKRNSLSRWMRIKAKI